MSYSAKVMNIMIASPSDVTHERLRAQEVIADWNSLHAERFNLVLMPLMWELDSFPAMGDRAQAIINRQLLDRADVLVAIFWSRLGSPTGKDISGTAEEIREMIEKGKPVMIYMSATPIELDSVDMKQYEALKQFIKEIEPKGLLQRHKSHEEFSKLLFGHLTRSMPDYANTTDAVADVASSVSDLAKSVSPPSESSLRLSDEAATLLLITAEDPKGGHVLIARTFGGTHVQANNTTVNKLNDRRSEAKWVKAVEDLVTFGLLKALGYKGEVFEITYDGYKAADQLAESGFKKIELDGDNS
jgi:hypothetical protein